MRLFFSRSGTSCVIKSDINQTPTNASLSYRETGGKHEMSQVQKPDVRREIL